MLLFLKVFFAEFIAEMGDKTQLMLIALTYKFKIIAASLNQSEPV
ncbi:TMEM165/GDT1 family protein [Butyribacter sp.]|nr:TMEM165/GDT1 family protein [Butyribacter sp.]